MIQFNLLPAVKVSYLKVKRLKRTIFFSATLLIIICAVVTGAFYYVVLVAQQKQLSSLDGKIKTVAGDIQSTKDINKVLTIQNQLSSIDSLHANKPETMRLFTYITQITTKAVSIQSFNLDFTTNKIDVQGQAPSVEEMNKYVDTLKFTTIDGASEASGQNGKNAFTQVVLSSYSLNDKGAGFSVSLNYNKYIFDSSETSLKLSVPKITSTRSETERPTDLFKVNQTPIGEED